MADHSDYKNVKRRKLDVDRVRSGLSQRELQRYILEVVKEPVVFLNRISQWKCLDWTPKNLAEDLSNVRTRFRFCPLVSSPEYRFAPKQVVMETDCHYLEGTFRDFYEWLTCEDNTTGLTFGKYPRKDYSCYADYKYMANIFTNNPEKLKEVDWGNLGFPERNGDQSTFWMGSSESFTPCHYDTYGCNLVAQIYGRKKWTLFSPSQRDCLYPTRIPYEESSVFSQVNIKDPDHKNFPNFSQASCYEVILEPGDVLFVPKHWWHFVESLETSISINTWIEMNTDSTDRIEEAITRALIYPLKALQEEKISYRSGSNSWINPSMREDDLSFHQSIEYIRQALQQYRLQGNSEQQGLDEKALTPEEFIDTVVSSDVVQLISQKLLEASSQHQTSNE